MKSIFYLTFALSILSLSSMSEPQLTIVNQQELEKDGELIALIRDMRKDIKSFEEIENIINERVGNFAKPSSIKSALHNKHSQFFKDQLCSNGIMRTKFLVDMLSIIAISLGVTNLIFYWDKQFLMICHVSTIFGLSCTILAKIIEHRNRDEWQKEYRLRKIIDSF